jgi:CheY-like chemotaxis protein
MSRNEHRPTILVVEDNKDNQVIMKAWLEHASYRVLLADTGHAGVAVAQKEIPDAILMDVALPGMDGWDAAAAIRSHPTTRAIPIIALTALALPEGRERATVAGVDGYLTKPATLLRVLEELERVLGRRGAFQRGTTAVTVDAAKESG